jgi:hypothetical protein
MDGSVIFGLEGDIVGNFCSSPPPSRVVRNRTRVGVKGGGSPPLPVRVCGGV